MRQPARSRFGLLIGSVLAALVVALPACHQAEAIRAQALADSRAVSFESIDGVQLSGRMFGPEGASAGIVLLHMLPADQRSWFDFADQLGALGYRTLTFDFRGYCPGGDAGCSGGSKDISAIWQDVGGAVGFLRTEGVRRIGLVGASMGGTASLVYASESGVDIDAVVTLSAPDAIEGLTAGPDVLQSVSSAKLFLAGNGDGNAAATAQAFYNESAQPKRVEILTTADHGTDILEGNQAEIAQNLIVGWLTQHVPVDMSRPIVFLTDYGMADEFVGVCHGVMLRIAPDVRVIDLTHSIPRQDVMHGALTLGRATSYLPEDAVYIGVVDPGVGSGRGSIAVRARSGALLVGPDNGLLSLAWEALGGAVDAVEITSDDVVLQPVSRTFHGRDVFAPAAAHLAIGMPLAALGSAIDVDRLHVLELPGPMVAVGAIGARVTGIDGFGNVQLNVGPDDLEAAGIGPVLTVRGRTVPRVGVFADVPRGTMGAIIDSQQQLALVVNQGSAADTLGLSVGKTVVLE